MNKKLVSHKQKIYLVVYDGNLRPGNLDMGFVSKSRAENYRDQKNEENKNNAYGFIRHYYIDTIIVDTNYMEGEAPEFVYNNN